MIGSTRRFSSTSGSPVSRSSSVVTDRVKDLVLKGQYVQALHLYKEQLHPHENSCAASILPSLIKASSRAENQLMGLQLHCLVLKTAAGLDPVVSNSLISMYAKFSEVQCARKLFDTMPQRDSISWNSMVNCYTQNGYYLESVQLFRQMYLHGFPAKPELVASVLSSCSRNRDFGLGREIHAVAVVNGWMEESVFLPTALLPLYLRSRDTLMAFRVFDGMEMKNEVSWTAMITGCVANQSYDTALHCFRAMQAAGVKPNRVTLVALLPLCAELSCIKHGKQIHGYAFRHGFDSEVRISSALLHTYGKCGESLRAIQQIFERTRDKDVVMWSSIIASYSQREDAAEEAIKLFHQMQMQGLQPNHVTLLAVVSACTTLSSVSHGRGCHGFILKSSLLSDLLIVNSLLNMYAKCGCLLEATQVFGEMSMRDNFSWSTLISAYGLLGHGQEALQLFREMQEGGLEPDAITFLAVLTACNYAGLVDEGQKLFDKAIEDKKISLGIEHYACHIDLLGRTGRLEDACEVVSRMPMEPSMKIWSSLISACKVHGRLDVAEMLALELVKLDPENAANYALLSMVYAEAGNWSGVEELRKCMKGKGLRKTYGYSRIQLEAGT